MKDGPPNSARDNAGGASQSGLRDLNARAILTLIRRCGSLPSAEIARRTGVSAQTVSNIIRALEADGLIKRGEAVRGQVGKPRIPVELNPEGAFSVGLSIGRRSVELQLVDFRGIARAHRLMHYPFPNVSDVFEFVRHGLKDMQAEVPISEGKLVGIGAALPNRLWEWLEVMKASAASMEAWRTIDLRSELRAATGLEAYIENDATSACVAEHLLGRGKEFDDYFHIFMGAFVGGGLVLGGKVVSGATRNAAPLGPMPVPDGSGGVTQLLNLASLHVLESALVAGGEDPAQLREQDGDWDAITAYVDPWLEQTGANLAVAAASIASVVELEAILIDGAMPESIRALLVAETEAAFANIDTTGLNKPQIETAEVGRGARATGAALLPILARYATV